MPLSKELLEKHKSDVFIETGTHRGQGVALALQAGFSMAYSCEPNIAMLARTPEVILSDPRAMIAVGTSAKWLPEFIRMAQFSNITFWLDAHPDGELSLDKCPLRGELETILNETDDVHSINVLIDDMRLFSPADQNRIEIYLMSMREHMEVYRVDGHTKDDIMVGVG